MVTFLAVLFLLQLYHPQLHAMTDAAETRQLLAWLIEAASLFCLLAALRQASAIIRMARPSGPRR